LSFTQYKLSEFLRTSQIWDEAQNFYDINKDRSFTSNKLEEDMSVYFKTKGKFNRRKYHIRKVYYFK